MSLLDVALCTAARTLHPESIGVITIDLSTSFIGAGERRASSTPKRACSRTAAA